MTRTIDEPTGSASQNVARRAWLVLVIACATQFMGVLDVTIVNVALPSMRESLNLSPGGLQWVVNGYTLTFAGFLLLGGRTSDLYGIRRVFLIGLVIFTGASLAGGLAQTGWQLVTARAVQGLGGAIVIPVTLSMITTTYPDGRARARALGVWAAVSGAGGALGGVIGGILTGTLNWRWVLIVNVPLGIALFAAAAWALVPDRRARPSRQQLDIPGAVTVTLGTGCLVGAIVGLEQWGAAAPATLLLAVSAVVLLGCFLVNEKRALHPLVPLSIFRIRSIALGNTLSMVNAGVVPAMFFFLSLYLQQVRGMGPLQAGLAMVPAALGIASGSAAASRLFGRLEGRVLLVSGSILTAVSLTALSQVGTDSGYLVGIGLPLFGSMVGMGLTGLPLTMAASSGVAHDQHGLAAGLLNASRQIGGAIGLAALVAVASAATAAAVADGGHTDQALTHGYAVAWLVAAAMALITGFGGLALPRTGHTRRGETVAQAVDSPDKSTNG